MKQYAERGELFGVQRASPMEFVGLCYSTLNGEHGNEWEIGGLTVPEAMRKLHFGNHAALTLPRHVERLRLRHQF